MAQRQRGVVVGFVGLAFLFDPFGEGSVDRLGALVIVLSAMWALGSPYSRGAPLPGRPLVSAGLAAVCGGLLLAAGAKLTGDIGEAEWSREALLALGYRGEHRRLLRVRLAAACRADVARLDVRA